MLKTVFLNSILVCGLLVVCGCNTTQPQLPFYNSPDFTPVFCKSKTQADTQITHQIADFSFANQFEDTITEKTVMGKIHVANFFFTACGSICPKMMNNLKIVNSKFSNDPSVVLLSYSVTPWMDSVPKLKTYFDNFLQSPKNWHLLTGSKAAIYQLARQSYFAEQDLGFTKDSTEFLHTEHLLLVDKSGKLRGIYNGTLQLEAEQLIKDISILKKEDE